MASCAPSAAPRRAAAALALAMAALAAPAAAHATDLRGRIDGASGQGNYTTPRSGVAVALQAPNGAELARSVTDGYGFYYFRNVRPGEYVLAVAGRRFRLSVGDSRTQDIPAVVVRN